jgi:hypothetical protein
MQDNNDSTKATWEAALINRTAELMEETGFSHGRALGMAQLEQQIAAWPKEWGNNLHVYIYGDFHPLDQDIDYPALGITVEGGHVTNTVILTATCVMKVRVKVRDRTLPSVRDAHARMNMFLGLWTIIDWGNQGIGWFCLLTHGYLVGGGGPFKKEGIEDALAGIERLPPAAKRKVEAALYWIREPKLLMFELYKDEILRIYAGYWNAFECLVEAVCLIRPQKKMTNQEKQIGITKFLADRQGKLNIDSLHECYKDFGDPGFVAKASHALRVCFPDRADGYIKECFYAKPKKEQLYAVRNAINHGDLDTNSLEERMRVEEKYRRLWMIVFAMLGCLIPFRHPLELGSK